MGAGDSLLFECETLVKIAVVEVGDSLLLECETLVKIAVAGGGWRLPAVGV